MASAPRPRGAMYVAHSLPRPACSSSRHFGARHGRHLSNGLASAGGAFFMLSTRFRSRFPLACFSMIAAALPSSGAGVGGAAEGVSGA